MRYWCTGGLAVLIAGILLWFFHGRQPVPPAPAEVEIVDPEVIGSKGGSKCHTGCSLKSHPLPKFTTDTFKKAVAAFAKETLQQASHPALETLLFFGDHTRDMIKQHGVAALPRGHRDLLLRELKRTHALVTMRIVDDKGTVRADLPWTRVPFGVKQHLHPHAQGIQEMSINGTVMRTGLGHIWARY